MPLNELQLVQLPCSLYDQRLLDDGTINTLRSYGIAVHARSLYLQGLLVTPELVWVIAPALRHHHESQSWLSNGWSLVQLALTWARRQAWMEAAVVGVTSETELISYVEPGAVLTLGRTSNRNLGLGHLVQILIRGSGGEQ